MGLATEETLSLLVSAGPALPAAQTSKFSTALEASHVISTSATAKLRSIDCRIDSTAPAGTYYLLLIDSKTLPAPGAVTLLAKPRKRVTSGVDDEFGVDFGERGIGCTAGIVAALSTTEFTLTVAGAYGSFEAEV